MEKYQTCNSFNVPRRKVVNVSVVYPEGSEVSGFDPRSDKYLNDKFRLLFYLEICVFVFVCVHSNHITG